MTALEFPVEGSDVSAPPGPVATAGRRWRSVLEHHAALGPVVVLAAVLNMWALTAVGWGNAYYAAAVRSMGSSWHNFLYASLDMGGFVSVDKPPFSLWVQTISSKLFGYSQASLLAPQAVLGTLAVVILYAAVQLAWGRTAGLVAALALALTPINVMVNHSNNTDAALVFLMVAGAALAIVAAHRGSLRWLVAAAAVSGTAMTAKMLAAVPLMPALLLAYLWCAPRSWRTRLWHTLVAATVLSVASLWWFTLVDLTPKDRRPFVGSSQTNSAFQLAFERNGVSQVEGGQVFGGNRAGAPNRPAGAVPGGPAGFRPGPAGNARGGIAIPQLGFNGGPPGALRLFNNELGTQVAWLIPFAVIGALAIVLATRLRPSARLATLIVFGGWALTAGGVFSITKGIVHPYYLANIGPPVAALAGIGIASAADGVRHRRRSSAALIVMGVTATVVTHWIILRREGLSVWRPWARPTLVVLAGTAIVLAGLAWMRRSAVGYRLAAGALAGATLFVPGMWSQGALARSLTGPLPYADALATSGNNAGGLRPNGGFTFLSGSQDALARYLRFNRTTERWDVAVSSAAQAETLIIEHGRSVMAMGGFSGSDPILTEQRLRTLFATGALRYVLQGAGNAGGPGGAIAGGGPFGRRQDGLGAIPATGPGLGGLLPGDGAARGPVSGNPNLPLGGLLPPAVAGPGVAPTFGPGRFGGVANASAFVTDECRVVPPSEWLGDSTSTGDTSFAGGPSSAAFTLYDCIALRR